MFYTPRKMQLTVSAFLTILNTKMLRVTSTPRIIKEMFC